MLIGLRETDDRIVSATFSALAVMVPILGASVVVGGERRKHFIEGRPKVGFTTSLTQTPGAKNFIVSWDRSITRGGRWEGGMPD